MAISTQRQGAFASSPYEAESDRTRVESFEAIYDREVDFVFRTVSRLGIPDAFVDDVVQNVFVVVHQKLASFEGRSSVRTWLFSIVTNVARDQRRSLRRKSPHLFAPVSEETLHALPDGTELDLTIERNEAWSIVASILDGLADDHREVFIAAELEEMTAKEIAEAMGLTPEKVYSLLRAARTEFERALAGKRRRLRGASAGKESLT